MVHKSRALCRFYSMLYHRTETHAWHMSFTERILVELLNLNSRDNGFRKHMRTLMTRIRSQNSVTFSPTTHKELSCIHIFTACKNRNGLNKIPDFLKLWQNTRTKIHRTQFWNNINSNCISKILLVTVCPANKPCCRLDGGSTCKNEISSYSKNTRYVQ